MAGGGYGLAVLSGLLGGIGGGLAGGTQLGDEEALQRERLAEQKRQFDESQYTDLGALIPGMGKVRTALAPHILAAGKQQADQARAAQLGQTLQQLVLEQAQGGLQPGTTLEMPGPGALVRPAAPITAVARPRDENLAALARFIPTLAQLSPKDTTEAVLSRFGPSKPMVVPENASVYTGRGFERAPTANVPVPPNMVPKTFKQGGMTYEAPDAGKANLSQGVAEVLQAQGINPAQATPQQIDAAIATVQARLDRRATLGATTIKMPEAGEREKIVQYNTLLTLGQDLQNRWAGEPTLKPGLGQRLGERELGYGARLSDLLGPSMTPEQRRFMADATDLISTYRRIQSGMVVTNPEALRTMPLVPDDPGALQKEQLDALVGWAKRNRTEIDRALVAANRSPGPAPLAPPTPPPAAPKGEALSRRDPRYQKLRQRGLTDQQIQQQFGVRVTD